jgi:hypothetical protein
MEYHLPILCNAAVEFGWSKDNVFSTSKVFYWDNWLDRKNALRLRIYRYRAFADIYLTFALNCPTFLLSKCVCLLLSFCEICLLIDSLYCSSYSTTRNPASFENKFWIILHQVQGLKFEICYFDRIKFVCLSGHWLG